MSGFEEPSLDINALFDAYERPNPIQAAHDAALERQTYLRNEHPNAIDIGVLLKETLSNLDTSCGHVGTPVRVMGRVILTTIDPKGVDFETGTIDPSALNRDEIKLVNPITVTSLGYHADTQWPITISHVAKSLATDTPEKVENNLYGSVFRDKRYHIPLDGTAHVESALPVSTVNLDLLKNFASEQLDAAASALADTEDSSDALRRLSKIDIKKNPIFQMDEEVQYHYALLITEGLCLSNNTPYTFKGVEKIYVPSSPTTFSTINLDIEGEMTGTILGTAINTSDFNKIAIATRMPFSDGITRDVIVETSETITIREQPILQLKK